MKLTGALAIVLALAIGIVPLFTDCQAQGRSLTLENGKQIPMKCHWTGRAELALAAPLLVGGILTTTSKRRESLRNVSMMNGFLGILAILLPTALIGVCGNPDMICNSVMKPSMILTGSLVVGISIVGVAQSLRMKDEAI